MSSPRTTRPNVVRGLQPPQSNAFISINHGQINQAKTLIPRTQNPKILEFAKKQPSLQAKQPTAVADGRLKAEG
jgi:hypothetical protein